MNRKFNPLMIFIHVIIIVNLSSCAHPLLYIPNASNVPLMKEKKEVRVTVSPTNYQASYALTEHIGLMANGQCNFLVGSKSQELDTITFKHRNYSSVVEAGAGYFSKIGRNWVFETYAGGGFGRLTSKYFYDNHNGGSLKAKIMMDYTKLFIQPSIGISRENVEMGFSFRASLINFSRPTPFIIHSTNNGTMDFRFDSVSSEKQNHVFLEPGFTFRTGYRFVKFHFQILYSYNSENATLDPVWYLLTEAWSLFDSHIVLITSPICVNLGVNLTLAQRFKKKPQVE